MKLIVLQKEELFAACTYAGKTCDMENDFYTTNDPSLGNCFTFNHEKNKYQHSIAGTGTGKGGITISTVKTVLSSH